MISVIIPCFNSIDFISRAIHSVLRQTYNNYEIILVDNNSTDGTHEILLDYQQKFPKLISVFGERKKGAPAARNKGLYEAKGDWLQFLDSDDELLPDKLEKQIAVAESSKADILAASHYVYKTSEHKTEVKILSIETGDVWEALVLSKLGSTSSFLWRKRAVLAVGGWDETKTSSQEYDLIFRMLKKNAQLCYWVTPQTIMHHRVNSISRSRDENRLIEIMDNNVNLRLQIKEYLRAAGRSTKQLNFIDRYIYTYLINTTGWHPLRLKKGIISAYVKKKLRQINLDLPTVFITKFFLLRLKNKVKGKIFKTIKEISKIVRSQI